MAENRTTMMPFITFPHHEASHEARLIATRQLNIRQ
eukprot:CAMPEP_0172628174 /NCGR_PEP_ID=MMETSP1068-20121228/160243_1 /TAXON_ID=35684 /ORGANISM="Pseudopedinella elastica, Strain CCMP716" /LENGTH=35 /DNA_ID= /DNA_START= /DNA_END= /DNA_ORIENTATION=